LRSARYLSDVGLKRRNFGVSIPRPPNNQCI
jgi:hypothetical protein